MPNQLHDVYVYKITATMDEHNHAQLLCEFKYRNDTTPAEAHGDDYVTYAEVQGEPTHVQIIPLSSFNRILTVNDRHNLSREVLDKVAETNPLITKASDNLAFRTRIIKEAGIPVIALDSIQETPEKFYYQQAIK